MDSITQAHWRNPHSQEGNLRYEAFNALLTATNQRAIFGSPSISLRTRKRVSPDPQLCDMYLTKTQGVKFV
jgi:hypothetical protein